MVKEDSRPDEEDSFSILIKSRVHIRGADAVALRTSRKGIYSPESTQAQMTRRVLQAGGILKFDISTLPDELIEAAYFYFGAATYAFDSNPGYRYSAIRMAARRELIDRNLLPLSTALRRDGLRVRSQLTLDDIGLGSIQFWQKVTLVVSIAGALTGIAADAPTAYHNFEQFYLPVARKVSLQAMDYIEKYFSELRKVGIDIGHETPPIDLAFPPNAPAITHRRRDG